MGKRAGDGKDLAMGRAVIRAQENERRRIAREIHDGPAQTLANLIFRVEICEKLLDVDVSQAREELARLRAQLREGLTDVRQIIYDLRPLVVEELGLFDATQKYLQDFQGRTRIQTRFLIEGERERPDQELELAAYRLIQESLTNVARHAGAENVTVKITTEAGGTVVEVIDDGTGFQAQPESETEAAERAGGSGEAAAARPAQEGGRPAFGITGMRERVRMLNGTFGVDSAPGKGTTVRFRLPREAH